MSVELLTQTADALANPVLYIWYSFIKVVPGIIAALLVIAIGCLIGFGVGWLIKKGLQKADVDKKFAKTNVSRAIGNIKISDLAGAVAKWYIIFVFLGPAVDLLRLGVLSDLLQRFVLWLPSLLVALLVVFVGLVFGDWMQSSIEKAKLRGIRVFSTAAKVVIIIAVAIIALNQIGVDVSLAENTFLIIVGAVALAFALAIGLGFGFALKDEAKGVIKKAKKKL